MKIRKIAALVLALMLLCSGAFALYVEDWWIKAGDKTYTGADKYVPTKGTLILECVDEGWTNDESATASLNSASYVQFIPVDSKGEFAVATVAGGDITLSDYDLNVIDSSDNHYSTYEIHVDYSLKPGKYQIEFIDPLYDQEVMTFGSESGLYNGDYSEVCVDVFVDSTFQLYIGDVANQYGVITLNVASSVESGDGANLMLWAAVTLVGAAGIVMMAKKRREA